jgi:hypothetical protein
MFPFLSQPTLNQSEYSDVGKNASPFQRDTWMQLRAEYDKAVRYYSGDIFREKVETETGEGDEPLLFPVGINLIKLLTLSMTDATFGEHDDVDPVLFVARNNNKVTPELKAGVDYLSKVLAFSHAGSTFWETDFSRNLHGAGVWKINPTLGSFPYVRWMNVPVQNFFPIFHPEDPDELIEAWMLTVLTQDQAREVYRIDSNNQFPVKVEHWTRSVYETEIDGNKVSAYSGRNPYGIVPFVFIPRVRTTDWYGESLIKDLYAPQDEMNMRLADIGDTLNYNAHPIIWGLNMPKGFNSTNYPLAANALWDLGRAFNGQSKPEVGMLQSTNPVPEASFKHIQFVYDWVRTSSFAPPIAFGEDNGGGQRSGVTLEIRLWPLLKAVRRSRAYLTSGLQRAITITGKILEQKKFSDVDASIIKTLLSGDVIPQYHKVLPRDQSAVVDEVVKLLTTPVPAISLETAQEELGRGMNEVTRIVSMMAEHPEWFQKATQIADQMNKGKMGDKEMRQAKSDGASSKADGGKDEK